MSLTNTFDAHIKAISTEQEWEQYKAMIMNKSSKEIAEAIVHEDHPPMDNEEAIVVYSKWINQHTNQALQELKAKVINQLEELGIPNMVSKKELYDVMDASTPQEIGEIKAKLELLDLIDEAINE